jgi:hypothetical protein
MTGHRKRNRIVSIFGQIEAVIALAMMAEGKGITMLAPTKSVSIDDCPRSAVYNERGEKARMVIVVPPQAMMEFNRRVEDLRQ